MVFKNLVISVFEMHSVHPGPGSSEEALESAQYPVWQQCGKPLGRPAFRLLHGVFHHGGAGLLQHRRPIRTHERQGLPRHRHLHVKVRQPLCLIAPSPILQPCINCIVLSLLANMMSEDFYCMSVTQYHCTVSTI